MKRKLSTIRAEFFVGVLVLFAIAIFVNVFPAFGQRTVPSPIGIGCIGDVCTSTSTIPVGTPFHSICVDNACSVIIGAGANQCYSQSDCITTPSWECVGSSPECVTKSTTGFTSASGCAGTAPSCTTVTEDTCCTATSQWPSGAVSAPGTCNELNTGCYACPSGTSYVDGDTESPGTGAQCVSDSSSNSCMSDEFVSGFSNITTDATGCGPDTTRITGCVAGYTLQGFDAGGEARCVADTCTTDEDCNYGSGFGSSAVCQAGVCVIGTATSTPTSTTTTGTGTGTGTGSSGPASCTGGPTGNPPYCSSGTFSDFHYTQSSAGYENGGTYYCGSTFCQYTNAPYTAPVCSDTPPTPIISIIPLATTTFVGQSAVFTATVNPKNGAGWNYNFSPGCRRGLR